MTKRGSRPTGRRIVNAAGKQGNRLAAAVGSLSDQALGAIDEATGRLTGFVERAGAGAGRLGDRVPALVERARRGAGDTTTALQTLPDPDLRIVAAASIGCAAGLYLAGAPRVVTLPTMTPALMAAAAILSRPGRVAHGR